MKLRHLIILLVVVTAYSAALVISTVALTVALWPKPTYRIEPLKIGTPEAVFVPESFDPGYYDLPYIVAGYRILAVETSENTCMPPGDIQLILQTTQPDTDAFLQPAPSVEQVESELNKLSIKPNHWQLSYAGPGITKGMVLSTAKMMNPHVQGLCEAFSHIFGPIPESAITPTPHPPLS